LVQLFHAGLEVEEHRAGHVLAARGLGVEHVDAAELRVAVAAALAAAADAVLVVHHPKKLCAHLVNALARLRVHNLAQRGSLEAGSTREKRAERTEDTFKKSCGHMARETGKPGGARAFILNGRTKWFHH
jgi:hypothetical protein